MVSKQSILIIIDEGEKGQEKRDEGPGIMFCQVPDCYAKAISVKESETVGIAGLQWGKTTSQ